jgi:hypothetical protein
MREHCQSAASPYIHLAIVQCNSFKLKRRALPATLASVNRSHANLHNQRTSLEIFRPQSLAYRLDTLISSSICRTDVYQHHLILAVVYDGTEIRDQHYTLRR